MKKIALITIFILSISNPVFASQRYVSLAPSTTEILFALGLGESVVGVSSYCDYPPEAKNKTRVGDFSHPNLEKIFSFKPDYIFCTGLEQGAVVAELRRLKFKVYVADPSSIRELFVSIKEIGKITNKTIEAEELTKKMESNIEAIKTRVKLILEKDRKKVFIEIWHEPLMTAGKGSFVDELITLAGGINIAHDVEMPYSIFSAEKVVSLNPDCIILAYMDKESGLKLIEARFGWDKIEAVRNRRVFNDIPADVLLRPGPRITEGLKEIYKRLYPKE